MDISDITQSVLQDYLASSGGKRYVADTYLDGALPTEIEIHAYSAGDIRTDVDVTIYYFDLMEMGTSTIIQLATRKVLLFTKLNEFVNAEEKEV